MLMKTLFAVRPAHPFLLGVGLAFALSLLDPSTLTYRSLLDDDLSAERQVRAGTPRSQLAFGSRQLLAEAPDVSTWTLQEERRYHGLRLKRNHQSHHHRHRQHHKRRRRHQHRRLLEEEPVNKAVDRNSKALANYKRRALDLAVNRLHILESLDGQLREFAALATTRRQADNYSVERANEQRRSFTGAHLVHLNGTTDELESPRTQQASANPSQLVCQLKLPQTSSGSGTQRTRLVHLPDCLAEAHLTRHVPPYMLNLHRQLMAEWRSSPAGAVQSMPYKSLIMRSFAQPSVPVSLDGDLALVSGGGGDDDNDEEKGSERNFSSTEHSGDHSIWTDRPGGGGRHDYNGDWAHSKATKAQVKEEEEEEAFKRSRLSSNGNSKRQPALNVVVELSAFQVSEDLGHYKQSERRFAETGQPSYQLSGQTRAPHLSLGQQPNRAAGERKAKREDERLSRWIVEEPSELQVAACDLSQRLLAAHERQDLCYWFQISEQLQAKINGSFEADADSRPQQRQTSDGQLESAAPAERLVEAELHLFKLLPEVWLLDEKAPGRRQAGDFKRPAESAEPPERNANSLSAAAQRGQLSQSRRQHLELVNGSSNATSTSAGGGGRRTTSNIYQLKTNLLEVSLYQILPKRSTSNNKRNNGSISSNGNRDRLESKPETGNRDQPISEEFPLRLLDIRRIDLHSSGWETFYVKGAVEDWIRDASSNLGLVIKAKSMFEEPIRIGLIRFADLYDHQASWPDLADSDSDSDWSHDRVTDRPNVKRQTSELDEPGAHSAASTKARAASLMEMGVNGQQQQMTTTGSGSSGNESKRLPKISGRRSSRRAAPAAATMGFDLSHQPILVIYTTAA